VRMVTNILEIVVDVENNYPSSVRMYSVIPDMAITSSNRNGRP
jgi:hypothetical protein